MRFQLLLAELKRRKVLRVAAAYGATAFVLPALITMISYSPSTWWCRREQDCPAGSMLQFKFKCVQGTP